MKKLIHTFAATIGLLAANATVFAQGTCHPRQQYHQPYRQQRVVRHYHQEPKQQSMRVPCLRGDYKDFSHKCYFPDYKCHGMYSQKHREWFYYYPQREVYIPVKYMKVLPPVVKKEDPALPFGAVAVDPSQPTKPVEPQEVKKDDPQNFPPIPGGETPGEQPTFPPVNGGDTPGEQPTFPPIPGGDTPGGQPQFPPIPGGV